MSCIRIDRAHSLGPRLDNLLAAQQRLRQRHPLDANHLFEVERAIDALAAGAPNSQSDTCERWVAAYLAGDGA